jgi:hypothetical protein
MKAQVTPLAAFSTSTAILACRSEKGAASRHFPQAPA